MYSLKCSEWNTANHTESTLNKDYKQIKNYVIEIKFKLQQEPLTIGLALKAYCHC
jgi:hypothetical protein